jgi:predicted dehydrogenase
VLHTAEGTSAVESLTPGIASGYDGEVRHLLAAIAAGRGKIDATMDDAALVTAVLEAERQSQRSNGPISLN